MGIFSINWLLYKMPEKGEKNFHHNFLNVIWSNHQSKRQKNPVTVGVRHVWSMSLSVCRFFLLCMLNVAPPLQTNFPLGKFIIVKYYSKLYIFVNQMSDI